jgi:hypothetical protein
VFTCFYHARIKLIYVLSILLVRCYVCSIALYGSEIWTLKKLECKYLESFEMWYWRIIEKINMVGGSN